ncbi:unnamed protein product [Closterium sp. Naga37s-1]|nr:unnamed protein product [Closterium sp. Naga37s-1]
MSTNVTVEHCKLHAGDDNVAITGGSSNILLRDLLCTAGHGISIGGLGMDCSHLTVPSLVCFPSLLFSFTSIGSLGVDGSLACVSDIRVQNVQLAALSNGLRIKTYQGGQGAVWNILYENVTMQDVTNAIIIDQVGLPCALAMPGSHAQCPCPVTVTIAIGTMWDPRAAQAAAATQ